MTYALFQLAAGSYDLLFNGKTIGSVVRNGSPGIHSAAWYAELLDVDSEGPKPRPFVEVEHGFDTLAELITWLGNPEIVRSPRGRPPSIW